jgi:hypothetical protein
MRIPKTVAVEGRKPPTRYYTKRIVPGKGKVFSTRRLKCEQHGTMHSIDRFSDRMKCTETPAGAPRSCMDENEDDYLYCHGHGGIHPYSDFSDAFQHVARNERYCLRFFHYETHEQELGMNADFLKDEIGSEKSTSSRSDEDESENDQDSFYDWDEQSDSSNDSAEEEEETSSIQVLPARTKRARRIVCSDDEEGEEEDTTNHLILLVSM